MPSVVKILRVKTSQKQKLEWSLVVEAGKLLFITIIIIIYYYLLFIINYYCLLSV